MTEYEDEEEYQNLGYSRPRKPYNPDRLNEWAINQEIHGNVKVKPMTDGEFYKREQKYDNFLKVSRKSSKVKNTK